MSVLAICNDEKDISDIKKMFFNRDDILIYTKNRKLYLKTKEEGKNIYLLDTNEKLYDIADDVWGVIDELNQFVDKYLPKETAHLYELSYHIEGGVEQELLDFILDLRYFDRLIRQFSVEEIYVTHNKNYVSEQAAIRIIKRARKINVLEDKKRAYSYVSLVQNLRDIVLKSIEAQTLKLLLKKVKVVGSVKKSKGEFSENSINIGFIKRTINEKVVNWSRPILEEIAKRNLKYEIICANRKEAHFWKGKGYDADYLERYINLCDIVKVYSEFYKYTKIVKKNRKKLQIAYLGYDISQISFDILIKSLLNSTAEMVSYNLGAKNFFKHKNFQVIFMHGNTNFPINRCCYYANKLYDKSPIFTLMPGDLLPIKGAYFQPYLFMLDLVFGVSIPAMAVDRKMHVNEMQPPFYNISSTIIENGIRIRKEENKEKVDDSFSVLWAPSYPLKGFSDYTVFETCNERVVSEVLEEDCHLYVKFHPNQNMDETVYLVKQYIDNSKLEIIDKKENIFEVFKKVQIVITDPSTVMLEAAARGLPVICIAAGSLFDSVSFYEEGLWIFKSIEDAMQLIVKLIRDKEYFAQWKSMTIGRQDDFFKPFVNIEQGLPFVLNKLEEKIRN